MKEIIICAAVIADNGKVIKCHRHSDGIRTIAEMGLRVSKVKDAQGFITSYSEFVNRRLASKIMKESGIPSLRNEGEYEEELYSEDLY